jgi:hypothetical protein
MNTADKITENWGPFVITVEWEFDDNPDLSWLGEYTEKTPAKGLYVNRTSGMILSRDTEELQLVVKWTPSCNRRSKTRPGKLTDAEFSNILFEAGYDPTSLGYHEYDPDSGLVALYTSGTHKILASHLPTMDKRGEYRYFVPGNDYTQNSSPEEAARCIAQDYERMESYERQMWSSMVCKVTITLAGDSVVGRASLWGIASDCDPAYKAELVEEVIDEAKEDVRNTYVDFRHKMYALVAATDLAGKFLQTATS